MPPNHVAFRMARTSDSAAIALLLAEAYHHAARHRGERVNPDEAVRTMAWQECRTDLLTIDGEIVGVLQTRAAADRLWIDNFAVHPRSQRRGHGRSLLILADHLARHAGLSALCFEQPAMVADSYALHEKFGFELEGPGGSEKGPGMHLVRHLTPPMPIRSMHSWDNETRSTA